MIIYYHCTRDSALLLSFLLTCHPYIHPFSFHEMIFILVDLVVRSPREGPPQQLQALFPSFNFTGNGSVTKWIVGAKSPVTPVLFGEIQIWRQLSSDLYTKVRESTIKNPGQNNNNFYEFDIEVNLLEFQKGDILGYYQPSTKPNSKIYLDDDFTDNPPFAIFDSSVDEALSLFNYTQSSSYNTTYPLISVETG